MKARPPVSFSFPPGDEQGPAASSFVRNHSSEWPTTTSMELKTVRLALHLLDEVPGNRADPARLALEALLLRELAHLSENEAGEELRRRAARRD